MKTKLTHVIGLLAVSIIAFTPPPCSATPSGKEISTLEQIEGYVSLPVAASTHLYAGNLISVNSSGNAIAAVDTASTICIGRAEESVDNSTGSAGDKSIRVKRGMFRFANSVSNAVTAASVGQLAYVEDDHTVAISTSNTIVAGRILRVETAGVWVDTRYYVPTVGTVADGAVTTAKIADANVTPAKTDIVEARTVTTTGATTGTISDTSTHVTVTSDDANKILILPTPTPGRMLVINNGATGYELRSSAPATVAINGGTGTNAESAIAANSTVLAICISATAWKAIYLDADGDVAKVEAAAP